MATSPSVCDKLNYEDSTLNTLVETGTRSSRCEWTSSESGSKSMYMDDSSSWCMALPSSVGFEGVSRSACEGLSYRSCYANHKCFWLPNSQDVVITSMYSSDRHFDVASHSRWGCAGGSGIDVWYGPPEKRKSIHLTGFDCEKRPVPANLQCTVGVPASETETFNSFDNYLQYLNKKFGDKMPDLHAVDPTEEENQQEPTRSCVGQTWNSLTKPSTADNTCEQTGCENSENNMAIPGYNEFMADQCMPSTHSFCSCTLSRTKMGYTSSSTGEVIYQELTRSEVKEQAWVVYANINPRGTGLCIPDVRVTLGERMILYDVDDNQKLCTYGSRITCGGRDIHTALVNEETSMSIPLKDMRSTSEQTCIVEVIVSGVPVDF